MLGRGGRRSLFARGNPDGTCNRRGNACGNNGHVDPVHVKGGDELVCRKDDDGECKGVDDYLGYSVAHDEEGVIYVEQDGDRRRGSKNVREYPQVRLDLVAVDEFKQGAAYEGKTDRD